jgi:hypothetical protein
MQDTGEDRTPYVTVLTAAGGWIACIMRWDKRADGFAMSTNCRLRSSKSEADMDAWQLSQEHSDMEVR